MDINVFLMNTVAMAAQLELQGICWKQINYEYNNNEN